MKYPDDFTNKIICGDCLEVMKEMPDECVDLILTDPPYPETGHFKNVDLSHLGKELFRIAKKNCFLVSDFFRQNLPFYLEIYKPFLYFDLLSAFVVNSMANCFFGMDRFIPSLVFKKGEPKLKKKWSNVIQVTRSISDGRKYHPTEKYLNYYAFIIRMLTNENDVVFDSFLGSGTTAEACKLNKRNFIGIEINPEYCKIAEERLAQGVL